MAAQSVTELTGRTAADNHYNLLVRGFQHGQLSLDKVAPPQLATLPDPYDPVANGRYRTGNGLHDMTYYKGRLYLYFGVAPALLLFWPWAALTGITCSTTTRWRYSARSGSWRARHCCAPCGGAIFPRSVWR